MSKEVDQEFTIINKEAIMEAEKGKIKVLETPVYLLVTRGSKYKKIGRYGLENWTPTKFPNWSKRLKTGLDFSENKCYVPSFSFYAPKFKDDNTDIKIECEVKKKYMQQRFNYAIFVRKTPSKYNDVIEVVVSINDGRSDPDMYAKLYDGGDYKVSDAPIGSHMPIESCLRLFIDASDYDKFDIKGFIKMVKNDEKTMIKNGQSVYDLASKYPVVWNYEADKCVFSIWHDGDKEVSYFVPPRSICFDRVIKTKEDENFLSSSEEDIPTLLNK